jgi:hypothetical protein
MAEERRESEKESQEREREETIRDLDVSEEEGEDVKGGLMRGERFLK